MDVRNQSLAYDFELFEEKKNNIVKIEESRLYRNNRTQAAAASKKAAVRSKAVNLVLVIAVVGILCAGLYVRGQITEVNDEINTVKKEIATLESDIVRLEMELESAVSFETLAEDAKALGMQPKEKSQTIYITLNSEDKAEVLSEEDESLFDSLKTAFAR